MPRDWGYTVGGVALLKIYRMNDIDFTLPDLYKPGNLFNLDRWTVVEPWMLDPESKIVFNPILTNAESLIRLRFKKKPLYRIEHNESSVTERVDFVLDEYYTVRLNQWSWFSPSKNNWNHEYSIEFHIGQYHERLNELVECVSLIYIHLVQNIYESVSLKKLTI